MRTFTMLRDKFWGTWPTASRRARLAQPAYIAESAPGENVLVELRSVRKSFGETTVLENVDLAVRDGELMTILGPSGSGKTTILRLIGGFTGPSEGRILLDGADISSTPINRRPFNTVFQDYALFPHMTVTQNVGYGLLVRRVPGREIARRVKESLELVQLGEFANRLPGQLSGGQRQRVALARAIICQPRLILLDEPLAALDVELRKQMQLFLKGIQREIRTTFLFVTHDQEEAIAMADRICVMNVGKIQQIGSPHDVYYRPQTEFVARFFGDNNLVPGRLSVGDDTNRRIETPIGTLLCSVDGQPEVAAAEIGRPAFAVVRPEVIAIGDVEESDNRCVGDVTAISFVGDTTMVEMSVAGSEGQHLLRVKLPSRVDGLAFRSGDRIALGWRARECRLVLD